MLTPPWRPAREGLAAAHAVLSHSVLPRDSQGHPLPVARTWTTKENLVKDGNCNKEILRKQKQELGHVSESSIKRLK